MTESSKQAHSYARVEDDRLICSCGHAEPFDEAAYKDALERMNDHIRAAYTDEEWEARMQTAQIATINTTTGATTWPTKGQKS